MSAEYPYAAIGARIRRLRKHFGFSLHDFADLHAWGATRLTNWETGHRRITVEAATQLRARYGVTLDWIYLGAEGGLPVDLARALAAPAA